MKVIVNYEGTELLVDEQVKNCLDAMKREEANRERSKRRHEVLWDSMLLEGMDAARDIVDNLESVEEAAVKKVLKEKMNDILDSLKEIDKLLLVDRYINQLKYREMVKKYGMPDSTIESKIKQALALLKKEFSRKQPQ